MILLLEHQKMQKKVSKVAKGQRRDHRKGDSLSELAQKSRKFRLAADDLVEGFCKQEKMDEAAAPLSPTDAVSTRSWWSSSSR